MEIYFDGTLIDSDNYISFTNEFKQFDESFLLGTTASNTITIEVPGNIAIPTNVLIKINDSNYSTMIVDSYEYEDNNILKLNLVDKMVLLNFNYNAKSIVPCTVKTILQDICTKAGITLATTTFTNQNLSVDYYDNTITARDYVGMIAELNGGFARINTSGALELVKFTGTPTNIDIDTCEDFRVGEKHKIERVVFDNGLLKFETSSDETKETLYLNSQNVYINDETTFNNIANQILNFEFYCFSTGNCEIKSNVRAGDLINFTDGTNNYPTIAQYSLNYVGGLNGGYELNINSQRQEETKIVGLGEQYKRLSVKIDRDKNEILETVESQISGVEKEINPTDTSSGSSIYLEDSAETELIDFEVEGKTTQETTTGVQIFDLNKVNETAVCVRTDTGIKLVNAWASQVLTNANILDTLEPNTTYTCKAIAKITARPTTIQQTQNTLALYRPASSGSLFTVVNTIPNVGTQPLNAEIEIVRTFTTPSDLSNVVLLGYTYYGNNNGSTTYSANGTIELNDLIIVKGTYTSSDFPDYEKYTGKIASPNPDYPSELVSVGYENYFEAEYLQTTANTNINANLYKDTYTLSLENKENFGGVIYIQLYKNNTLITTNGHLLNTSSAVSFSSSSYWYYFSNIPNGNKLTFTLDDDYSLKIALSNATGSQKAFLVKGTQAHSYIPYGKYGIEIKTAGKNLLNATKYSSGNYVSQLLTLKATTYTVSFEGENADGIYVRKADGTLPITGTTVVVAYNKKQYTFTLAEEGQYYIQFYKANPGWASFSNAQLEQGTQATDYEEYKSNTHLYTLDNPLRSIGDTKDLLYIKNGMLYVDRKIGSVVLNGSENWGIDGTLTDVIRYRIPTSYFPNTIGQSYTQHTKSNYFKFLVNYGNNTPHYYIGATTGNSYFFMPTSIASDINSFKTWLSTHNTEVQYILAEPYTEELGEVQIPSTYKGITHINTTDELEPNMNITYVRDTLIANYVESHVSELKINERGIEARVQTIEESDYGGQISELSGSLTSQEARLDVISTNIDTTTGEVREVTTSNGLKFNSQGLNLYTGQDSYNTLINNVGTYYKDGDTVISETTKDGFMATNSKNKGQHSYSYDETNDLYEFIDERVEADGEYCYATFYNGEE